MASLQEKQNTQGGKLAGLFVRRPVLAVVINALIVVGGLAPAMALPQDFWSDEVVYEPAPPRQVIHRRHKAPRAKMKETVAPTRKPQHPLIVAVSIKNQSLKVYDAGGLFAEAPVSTGMPGHSTPLGIFSVIQKNKWHRSNIYSGAPMPYMQRLTWSGIAMHAGALPGYPASHGCIRLPHEFARLLFGVTRLGMTVVITNDAAMPRVAPADTLLRGRTLPDSPGVTLWRPEASPSGPLSIVLSAADRRILVLRNGILIGSAPVTIDVPVTRTSAYLLRLGPDGAREWLRIALPGESAGAAEPELRDRVHVPEAFGRALDEALRPGTSVVVTADSLRAGATGRRVNVVEDSGGETPAR